MTNIVVPLVAVYRLNCPRPQDEVVVLSDECRKASFMGTGLKLSTSAMKTVFMDGETVGQVVPNERYFPPDAYLAVLVRYEQSFAKSPHDMRADASAEIAEMVSKVELAEPGLIIEKVFEDVVNPPGMYIASPEGPEKLTGRPDTPVETIAVGLGNFLSAHMPHSSDAKRRFKLASRWFQKGLQSANEIDRFLSLYVALEVYPSADSADVPGRVCTFVKTHLHPEHSLADIKSALSLGRIAGLRAEVVHDGLSSVSASRSSVPSDFMEIIEAVVRASLMNLLGGSYRGELRRWLS